MEVSDEMKKASEWADEATAKQQERAQKLDRKAEYFADDRAAELDRAVANAQAAGKDRKAKAQAQIEKTRRRAAGGEDSHPAA